MNKKRAFLNWSSGKDAAYSLYQIQAKGEFEIAKLVTTVNEQAGRVSMHGVREELLKSQADCLGLPLEIIYLPENTSMQEYEKIMSAKLDQCLEQKIKYSVFGDILLEDLKAFREQQLSKVGMKGIFPLWGKNTFQLIHEMIESGLKAIVVCVNEQYLDKSFVGRIIDRQFVSDLPKGVDPCGENGEFHTFVFDGPMFKKSVSYQRGEVVYKTYNAPKQNKEIEKYGFWFLDLFSK